MNCCCQFVCNSKVDNLSMIINFYNKRKSNAEKKKNVECVLPLVCAAHLDGNNNNGDVDFDCVTLIISLVSP